MKDKIHTVYKLKNGKKVPGVTTIISILAKPALIHWAWDLGTKGVDYRKFRDDKADIGSLAHYLIMCYLKKETPDTSDYSKKQIDQAENCIISFFEWKKMHSFEPILIESPLVSEKYKFGGTPDLLAKINGEYCLIDFKTGKGIYVNDMFPQLAAYSHLLQENNYKITNSRILRIGREESEGFEERLIQDIEPYWEIFKNCLSIYNIRKGLRE